MVVAHLYSDLLNLYGENGNIKALKKHLEEQGVMVNVEFLTINDSIDFKKYITSLEVIILILNKTKTNKQTPVTITLGALSGSLNRIANYILVFALTFVDASVQYPLVTGGTIIVSTVICFIRGVKPSKKELASVVLAFLGMVILFAFPV